jgi:hypothetical protein
MGGKYPAQGIFFIFAGMDSQSFTPVGGIVFMKPKKHLNMGKPFQSQKRVAIGFKDFNPGPFFFFANHTHRKYLKCFQHCISPI